MTQKHKQPMHLERIVRPNQEIYVGPANFFTGGNWDVQYNGATLTQNDAGSTLAIDFMSFLNPGDIVRRIEWYFNATANDPESITLSDLRFNRSLTAVGLNSTNIIQSVPQFSFVDSRLYRPSGGTHRLQLDIDPGNGDVTGEENFGAQFRAVTGDGCFVVFRGMFLTVDQGALL